MDPCSAYNVSSGSLQMMLMLYFRDNEIVMIV